MSKRTVPAKHNTLQIPMHWNKMRRHRYDYNHSHQHLRGILFAIPQKDSAQKSKYSVQPEHFPLHSSESCPLFSGPEIKSTSQTSVSLMPGGGNRTLTAI
jgi:hypothetical protein